MRWGGGGMAHFSSGRKVIDPFHDIARDPIGDTFTVWTNDETHVDAVREIAGFALI
jgi:hypothetical protein